MDYGDEGVVEYVISELVRYLHGFGEKMWKDEPVEITGLKVGIVGLGTSGTMMEQALSYLGAEISYYNRTRKPKQEGLGHDNKHLLNHGHVNVLGVSSGRTKQAFVRLSEKVLNNIERYFSEAV